jgi:hypothetical protein
MPRPPPPLCVATPTLQCLSISCSKIAEAEAGVSVNEKKWLVMHVHVQMRLDELVSQSVCMPALNTHSQQGQSRHVTLRA